MTWVWIDRKTRYYAIGGLYKPHCDSDPLKIILVFKTQSTFEADLLFALVYSHYVQWCKDRNFICLHKMIFPRVPPLQAEKIIVENTLELFEQFCNEQMVMLE